ncbi:hypothetical protein F5148DRAFT_1296459 [Russula earlei]|uniref:Uncharacterized protein n=1 Tax=Russula earlei TaxID=71964 RepID=A0ACC0TRC9_9AGAM|nr:hypothetical protein F5148DRAFT_1296459 [Russula earlei]
MIISTDPWHIDERRRLSHDFQEVFDTTVDIFSQDPHNIHLERELDSCDEDNSDLIYPTSTPALTLPPCRPHTSSVAWHRLHITCFHHPCSSRTSNLAYLPSPLNVSPPPVAFAFTPPAVISPISPTVAISLPVASVPASVHAPASSASSPIPLPSIIISASSTAASTSPLSGPVPAPPTTPTATPVIICPATAVSMPISTPAPAISIVAVLAPPAAAPSRVASPCLSHLLPVLAPPSMPPTSPASPAIISAQSGSILVSPPAIISRLSTTYEVVATHDASNTAPSSPHATSITQDDQEGYGLELSNAPLQKE